MDGGSESFQVGEHRGGGSGDLRERMEAPHPVPHHIPCPAPLSTLALPELYPL